MNVASRALRLLVGSVLTLLAGELFVRVLVIIMNRPPIVVSDACAGWAGRANLSNTTVVYRGGKFVISTDREGHRRCYPMDHTAPANAPTIFLLGDSYAFGVGVNDDETVAWFLARRTPHNVVNLGVLGYGTDQELLKLEELFERRPDATVRHVVVLVFDNDFVDVQHAYDPFLGRHKPHFRVANQELVRTDYQRGALDRLMDVSRLVWLVNSKCSMIFARPNPPAEAGRDLVVACLQAMRRVAEARGAQLHILAHHRLRGPLPFSPSLWNDFLQRAGATDITERLRTTAGPDPIGPDGGHWSAAGNALAAQIVFEATQ